MENRMIGIIAAIDQDGLYQIGEKVPWGEIPGKTVFKYDNEHFKLITQKTASPGKKNVIVTSHQTAKWMAMHPFESCRTIVLSHKLKLERVNLGRSGAAVLHTERTAKRALELALTWEDCGHVFFVGVGSDTLSDMLHSGLCNCAFVTIVKCDAFSLSPFKDEPFYAKNMLDDQTFVGMKRTTTASVDDTWDDQSIELEFRNYHKV